jgi:hypothetical protein
MLRLLTDLYETAMFLADLGETVLYDAIWKRPPAPVRQSAPPGGSPWFR